MYKRSSETTEQGTEAMTYSDKFSALQAHIYAMKPRLFPNQRIGNTDVHAEHVPVGITLKDDGWHLVVRAQGVGISVHPGPDSKLAMTREEADRFLATAEAA